MKVGYNRQWSTFSQYMDSLSTKIRPDLETLNIPIPILNLLRSLPKFDTGFTVNTKKDR